MKFPEKYRFRNPCHCLSTPEGATCGLFRIPPGDAKGRALNAIACDGTETGWEHVSVSLADWPAKTPSWDEMCVVKDLFWDAEECVVQYHPPRSQYVNQHPGVLHLWRKVGGIVPMPMPPKVCV